MTIIEAITNCTKKLNAIQLSPSEVQKFGIPIYEVLGILENVIVALNDVKKEDTPENQEDTSAEE